MTLALIFQQTPEVEASINKQLAQENNVLLARGTKESNQLHKSWRRSTFCKGVAKALAGEEISFKDEKAPSSDEESEVDVEDASLMQISPSTQTQEDARLSPTVSLGQSSKGFDQTTWARGANIVPRQLVPPVMPNTHRPSIQQPVSPPGLTPLPVDFWKLLETYSLYTQSWLPISEKFDVLKLSYSYPEQGLILNTNMPDSGHHAEMWSIFAVGCLQDSSVTLGNRDDQRVSTSLKLYDIARLLIPDELGRFDLNHIKALLNLAVFNISRSQLSAAWLLVGAASRILVLGEQSDVSNPRRKNVLASCFMLDNLLALHLKQRPYLEKADIAWMGKIEEDGMEEWQPWSGELNLGSTGLSRLPTLALSSFNNLLEIVDILVSTGRQSTARNFLHEMIGRLEVWKSSLPPKLDYIRSDSASTPLTPPAVLLHLTYFVTAFSLVPSQAWLQRTLDLLESLRNQLGFAKSPPIILCLLQSLRRGSTSIALDQVTHIRMQKLFAEFSQTCLVAGGEIFRDTQTTPSAHTAQSPGLVQMRNADMVQMSPQSFSPQLGDPGRDRYPRPSASSSLLNDLLPDMNPNRQEHVMPSLDSRPLNVATNIPNLEPPAFDSHDPYNPFVSGDLESFFDELSSLHGAKKLQNQSQFMENLGFSSEVSMADLLATDPGRFMPMPTSGLGSQHDDQPPQFPLDTFYDPG